MNGERQKVARDAGASENANGPNPIVDSCESGLNGGIVARDHMRECLANSIRETVAILNDASSFAHQVQRNEDQETIEFTSVRVY